MKTVQLNGRVRRVLGMRQVKDSFRLILNDGETYCGHYPCAHGAMQRLNDLPAIIEDAPDGNGNLLTYGDGKILRSGGVLIPYDDGDIALLNATRPREEPAGASTAKLNARLDTVLKIGGMEGKPSRGQQLIDEVRKRMRDGMTPIDVCREIARDAYAEACKTGTSAWMRKAAAVAANKAWLHGDKPTKQGVERLAQTLKRERNRALAVPGAKPKRTK